MSMLRTMVEFRDRYINMRDASAEQVKFGKTLKSVIFDKWGNVTNIKNGNHYTLLSEDITNATNDRDGQKMTLYTKGGKLYVRENKEFQSKFE